MFVCWEPVRWACFVTVVVCLQTCKSGTRIIGNKKASLANVIFVAVGKMLQGMACAAKNVVVMVVETVTMPHHAGPVDQQPGQPWLMCRKWTKTRWGRAFLIPELQMYFQLFWSPGNSKNQWYWEVLGGLGIERSIDRIRLADFTFLLIVQGIAAICYGWAVANTRFLRSCRVWLSKAVQKGRSFNLKDIDPSQTLDALEALFRIFTCYIKLFPGLESGRTNASDNLSWLLHHSAFS